MQAIFFRFRRAFLCVFFIAVFTMKIFFEKMYFHVYDNESFLVFRQAKLKLEIF